MAVKVKHPHHTFFLKWPQYFSYQSKICNYKTYIGWMHFSKYYFLYSFLRGSLMFTIDLIWCRKTPKVITFYFEGSQVWAAWFNTNYHFKCPLLAEHKFKRKKYHSLRQFQKLEVVSSSQPYIYLSSSPHQPDVY